MIIRSICPWIIWQLIEIQTLPAVIQFVHMLFPQENKPAVEFCSKFNTVSNFRDKFKQH